MSLTYPLQIPEHFWWECELRQPGSDEPHRISCQFVELGRAEMQEITDQAAVPDEALLRRVLIGWRGIVDADGGAEVPFGALVLDALLDRPWFRLGVATAYYDAVLGQRRNLGN